jgi:aminopeptidase
VLKDARVAKLADLLVNYCIGVKEGDWCVITGEVVTLPLIRELGRAILEAGGVYDYRLRDGALSRSYIDLASDAQLKYVSPVFKLVAEEADVYFNLFGTSNTRRMSSADSARVALSQKAAEDVITTYFERTGSGDLNWVISRFPTEADAQEAEMSLDEYEDFVYKACLLEEDDPIAAWKGIHDKQAGIVKWLAGKKEIAVSGPRVDLTMSVDGRNFVNSDGKNNMPSGEVFTSPIEDSMNGHIAFSYPTILGGRQVEGVQLTFKDGVVVEASADKGEDYLLSQIDQDEGGRRVGEFAIGTNYAIDRFTGDTLFDEKIGGTMHMALGLGIREAGGENKSIIHWDMVHDMRDGSRIEVDGELLYEDGDFKI